MESEFLRPNALFGLLERHGYSPADLMTAFPYSTEAEIVQRLEDNRLQNRRQVWRLGHLGIRRCSSRYFNIDDSGSRSLGLDISESSQARHMIHCYGGSTTLCSNVADWETWPSYLQGILDKTKTAHFKVANWGAGNLTSLQSSARLLVNCLEGRVPDTAVFYGGMNDCFYGWGDVDGVNLFLDRCLEASQHSSGVAMTVGEIADLVPRRDVDDPLRRSRAMPSQEEVGEVSLSVRRVRAIARQIQVACAENWGFRIVRFWEPTPFAHTRASQDLVPRIRQSNHRLTLTAEVHRHLKTGAGIDGLSEDLVDLSDIGQEELDGPLWIDEMHASPILNRLIARAVFCSLSDRSKKQIRRSLIPRLRRAKQQRSKLSVEFEQQDPESNLYPLW